MDLDKENPIDLAPPRDKWNLIYIVLVVHGIGVMTAWNMFITAKDYFVVYKLKAAPEYADNYLTYVGWASQLPNVVFNWLNLFVHLSGDLATRIMWSLCIEVVIFVFTITLAMLDSRNWPAAFFWLTMISVLILNSFNAIYQNCVYGTAARLPAKYTGAVVFGNNLCGTLVVFLSWGSELFGSQRTSAIYYFITAIIVLFVCFDTYIALPLNTFYRYHDTLQQNTPRADPAAESTSGAAMPQRLPYLMIIKQAYVQLYNIFIVFFVSLSVFLAVISEIKPLTTSFMGSHFTMVTCFLTFNFTAMMGSITASLWQYPTRRWLWVFTTVRFIFIPFFLLCNYAVKGRKMSVVVTNDWVYWFGAILLGWSSGHGSSLGMMYVSGGDVAPEHASTAGMLGAAMLVTGILCGLLFTYLCPLIVR